MNDPAMLDKTFHTIMKRMVDTGVAPHYTEVAAELGLGVEEGRKAVHDLFASGIPGWLFPGTSLIASFAPFNNLPTQYRITIEGAQKWFGQWAFESLAVCWLFPGKTVRVDCPCLDCGLPIAIEIRDGKVLRADPEGLLAYVAVPFGNWRDDIAYAWTTMNFFRSEDHIRRWAEFKEGTEEGILPLQDLLKLFSTTYFRRRLDPDWVSKSREYLKEWLPTLIEIGKTGWFWRRKSAGDRTGH